MRKHTLSLTLGIMALFGIHLNASPLPVGADAPAISTKDQDGNPVQLGDLLASGTTLVYFYPKADTPGCTAQACSLRDSIEDLKSLGLTVIGVSKDNPVAQKKFAEKYQLPFKLIADESGEVIAAFGVPTLIAGIPARHSFLVKDGKIVWHSPKAGTANHAKEVSEAVAAIP